MARRPPAGGYSVNVNGLQELVRALGQMDRGAKRRVQIRLRDAADVVAQQAKVEAEREGLHRTGKLIRGIRPFYRGTTAGVRSGAKRAGYPYPEKYEYGGRPFLEPALEHKRVEVEHKLELALDDIARDGGF